MRLQWAGCVVRMIEMNGAGCIVRMIEMNGYGILWGNVLKNDHLDN